MDQPATKFPSVNLTKYVNVGGNEWRFCPVVFASNGRLKQDRVMVRGQEKNHPEGTYYIEWREDGTRRRQSVSKSAPDAHAAMQRTEQLLKNRVLGIEVVLQPEDVVGANRLTVAQACRTFLEETQQQRKSSTYDQYKVALSYFQQSCDARRPLVEIERKDLLNYMTYLRQVKKLSNRTIWTKLHVVMQLLKENNLTGIIGKKDRPRYVEAEPEVYSREEIDTFLAACDPFSRTLFEFFWMTGFREQELQTVTWKDIDFKEQVVRVTAKPRTGFIPKTWEEREVPIPDRLVESLNAHRDRLIELLKRQQATRATIPQWVFPNKSGGVERKFLRLCKTIAWRTKLNCGNCDNGKHLCLDKPCCDNWYLHKFRSTFATMHLQAGVDLRTVQAWMGHKDLASTMRYLKPARGKDVIDKVNTTFGAK
jgi:integrase